MSMERERKLLALAAKAADIPLEKYGDLENGELWIDDRGTWWNPLASDEDAFRLAIKLCITVVVDKETGVIEAHYGEWDPDTCCRKFIEEDTVQRSEFVAARVAIVRAAAELRAKL